MWNNRIITSFAFSAAVMLAAGSVAAQTAEDDEIWKSARERADDGSVVAMCELGELVIRGPQAIVVSALLQNGSAWLRNRMHFADCCAWRRCRDAARAWKRTLAYPTATMSERCRRVLTLARQGDLEMQIQLAKMHHKALGTKEDLELAGFWYKTAASRSNRWSRLEISAPRRSWATFLSSASALTRSGARR